MTAFRTDTNTGSTTFTNSWGSVSLLPSGSTQKASGFSRTTGWRYFEWYIDDQGGDVSKLLVGVGAPPQLSSPPAPNYMMGGLNPAPPSSLTVCTGDTLMFAVDMTGNGRDHSGATASPTISTGSGEVLTRCIVDVGKNGTWLGTIDVAYAWPSHGYPMVVIPWAQRNATSSSAAMVSLRVQTTSFVYAIPSGMVAWADGPEGGTGVPTADDFSTAWDPAESTRFSLSASNIYAVNNVGAFGQTNAQLTVNLAGLTGKRYVEFWAQPTGYASEHDIGLLDSTTISLTSFADMPGNALFWQDHIGPRSSSRGASLTACVTNGGLSPVTGNAAIPGCGIMIDFTNKLYWHCQPNSPGGSSGGPWIGKGNTTSAFTGATVFPYSWGATSQLLGFPISITASTTQLRIAIKVRNDSVLGAVYINGGQIPFGMYPLLPGAKSMNGGRVVTAGQGDTWDTVNNPASATYGAAGISILKRYVGGAQCAGSKFAGKKYFELHTEQDGGANGVYLGLRKDTATTFTAAGIASIIDQALLVKASGTGTVWRYGTNIGTWSATASYYNGAISYMAPWHGVAVDFDAGNIWVGSWNYQTRTMNWGVGSDPATGTLPHMTFTASTTLRIFIADEGGAGKNWARVNLVQDDNNVVGLPSGFTTWGGTAPVSLTATPSGGPSTTTASGALRVLWPYGVQT